GDRRGDIGAGLAALDRALKEVPDFVPALLKQADLFARDGREGESIKKLERVVAVEKEPPSLLIAHLALGALLDREAGDTARAAKHLRAALAIDENHVGALGALLDIEMRRDEFEAATATAA